MHVVDNKLVGTIVSDVYTENGSVIIVLTDGDTTPVREMQTYSYIQTKELAEIGIAINPKGVVTIPVYTLAGFNGELDSSLYAITVKYNGELYQIGLADFIELEAGEDVEYDPYEEGAFPGQTIGAVIPPFSDENAGQIVSVNEETGKLEWRDETEELPTIAEGDAGKVLKVNSGGTGVEWGEAGQASIYNHVITLKMTYQSKDYYSTFNVISTRSAEYTKETLWSYMRDTIQGSGTASQISPGSIFYDSGPMVIDKIRFGPTTNGIRFTVASMVDGTTSAWNDTTNWNVINDYRYIIQ